MTALFLAALSLTLALRFWLSHRQERCVRAHREAVPEPFRGRIPPEAHRKAADYTIARLRLARVAAPARAGLLLLWTLGGGLDLLDRAVGGHGVLFLLGAALLTEVVLLPLEIHRVFRLEERFGFNRTTPAEFVKDLLKQALLAAVLGGLLAWAALWLMREGGARWWLFVWALWVGFSLLVSWAWPVFIAPLFHRFTPLEEGELSERLRRLLDRVGFRARGIFVMDGSRRSTHANAFFAGFGRNRRIVLYDTLRDLLGPAEIEAVLAHELGHYRHRHVWTRLALSAAAGLGGLWLLSFLIEQSWFFEGLGVSRASAHSGLLLFLWIAPLFVFPLRPLAAAWSRRQEYQADAFAARHAEAAALVRALVHLYDRNASTLTPDPVHSAFYDSHPPARLRIQRLERNQVK